MNYTITKQEQYALISIENERIDHDDSQILQSVLIDLLEDTATDNVIIDASQIKQADESLLGPISFASRRFKAEGGILILSGACQKLQEMIQVSQISDLEMLPTLVESVDLVFMHEIEKQLRSEGDML